MQLRKHPFHLVDQSPWPFYGALALFILTINAVSLMQDHFYGFIGLSIGLFLVFFTMFVWWRDIYSEANYGGSHTKKVADGHYKGFLLFIASEVLFFFSCFWAYFHSALHPTIEINTQWTPYNQRFVIPYYYHKTLFYNVFWFDTYPFLTFFWTLLFLPLLNTFILVTSSLTITLAHILFYAPRFAQGTDDLNMVEDGGHKPLLRTILFGMFLEAFAQWHKVHDFDTPALLLENEEEELYEVLINMRVHYLFWSKSFYLFITILLGILFTCLQTYEYIHAPFNLSDGIFPSVFFLITGFHGLHVIIGTIFLIISYLRIISYRVVLEHHVGYRAAITYWHFVDIIWLFVFFIFYILIKNITFF